MTAMGSTERRLACLKIAASMTKRVTKEDVAPSAEELMLYAAKLEQFAWHGEFADKEHADAFEAALQQMVEVIRAEKRTQPIGLVQDGRIVMTGEIVN